VITEFDTLDLFVEEADEPEVWAELLPSATNPAFCCWNSFSSAGSAGTFGSCGSSASTGSTYSSSC
jgi:hypothetical protein